MEPDGFEIRIRDRQSLIHLGSLDSFDITEGGKGAARQILSYLDEEGGDQALHEAVRIYEEIIPNENFGGEYTALEWLCKYFLAEETMKEELTALPMVKSFRDFWCGNHYDNLRTYISYKYHFKEYGDGDNTQLKARMRFLEDFILFNNPDRERWETTRENMDKLGIAAGDRVADVGCGSGYYTFRFSDVVGENGKVYAIETNPLHLEYLEGYVRDQKIENVEVVKSSFEGIGLPPDVRVDVVYICSLYHNVYAAFTDAERDSFVGSIRRALHAGGRLVLVDNDLVTDEELPYHGPYADKELLISQLYYYGFKLRQSFQFTPQRYVLLFDMEEIPEAPGYQHTHMEDDRLIVCSPASLVRYRIIGTSTSGYTIRGKAAGREMYEGIVEDDSDKLERAYDLFNCLYPKERVGDDYTALMWFIRLYLADSEERRHMTEDPLSAFYADYFMENDWERLRTYLFYKFHLEKGIPEDATEDTNLEYDGKDFPIPTLNEWNEFLIFNNPNRFLWEKTFEMLDFIKIRPGQTVADVGCGGGFFSWAFSKAVGPEGKVYATEINKAALHYLEEFAEKAEVRNIETVTAKMNDICLPEDSLDLVFMCSMYHAVYITDIEFVKDAFVESLRKALKEKGRLVIVDNNITEKGIPSYYGPGICPELVIAQLRRYGFLLKDSLKLIPQRYTLVFEKDPTYVKDYKGREMHHEKGRDHGFLR